MFLFTILLICFVFIYIKYNGTGIPVLLYHQVNGNAKVTPERFEKHLKVLKLLGLKPIKITDAGRMIKTGIKIPKKSVIITFDDGYFDNYLHVLPLLKKYKTPITLFLNTGYLLNRPRGNDYPEIKNGSQANADAAADYFNSGSAQTLQYMTWEEIGEMHGSGLVDIQLHTQLHKPVFSNLKLQGIVSNKNIDRGLIYIYKNKAEEGYPIFARKGETAAKKVTLTERFVNDFRYYYFKNLMGGVPIAEQIKAGQKYIDSYIIENPNEFSIETDEQCEQRIRDEIKANKTDIQEKLNKKAEYFAWPWGDRDANTQSMIKKEFVLGFATCIEGTNSTKMDLDKIKRVEVKNQGAIGFGILVLILNNIVFGTIYEYCVKGIKLIKKIK